LAWLSLTKLAAAAGDVMGKGRKGECPAPLGMLHACEPVKLDTANSNPANLHTDRLVVIIGFGYPFNVNWADD
jgi:hypothetical protein